MGSRVLFLCGYFDWFSGYQETALAKAFAKVAETEVIASDRVAPIFSDEHLATITQPRRYVLGQTREHGVTVTRVPTVELRSMVWSPGLRRTLARRNVDLLIQFAPGQMLSVAGSYVDLGAKRVVLYGDNGAMWSHLSRAQRVAKATAFAMSKGVAYRLVNGRADAIYGCTSDTLRRLRRYSSGKAMRLLPLPYDQEKFGYDGDLRDRRRRQLGYADSDVVVIAAGKFQAKKRLDLLVAAVRELAPVYPGLRLLVTGVDGGASSIEFARRVRAEPILTDRVSIHGFVSTQELNELFNTADIGVWPRMPAITIQQAMGTGLAVLLPDNDWVGHLLRPGSGAYFQVRHDDDVTSLADGLRRLLDAPDLRTPESRLRRQRVNSSLSADAVASRILDDVLGIGGVIGAPGVQA